MSTRLTPYRCAAGLLLACLTAACTDWDAASGQGPLAPLLTPQGAAGAADAGAATDAQAAGLPPPSLPRTWETWTPPPVDVPPAQADSGTAADAGTAADGAGDAVADAVPPDDAGPVADADPPLEDGVPLDDGVAFEDSGPAGDAAATSDGFVSDGAGFDVPKADGPKTDLPKTDVPKADLPPGDATVAEIGGTDAQPLDAQDVFVADAAPDAGPTDVFVVDGQADAVDAFVADGLTEVAQPDAFVDVGPAEGLVGDGGLTDAIVGDGGVADAPAADAGPGDVAPDWQGYDLKFPADADIYGGAISSCLAVYLYQQETCGKDAPSAACINQVATEGSLYANALFEPLRACQVQACVPSCAGSTANDCMEGCMGKYCATQFLGCVSNAASGTQSCAQAFACADQYEGKLQTIASKCYAAASPVAQVQLSALVGCVTKPQTDSCVTQMAACFGSGTGTASCSKTFQCLEKCKEDESCNWACLGNGSAKAVQLLDSLWDCAIQVCGPKCAGSTEPACQDQCLFDQCNKQIGACLAD